jgi:DNA-binding NarL/FixJ family response regulator
VGTVISDRSFLRVTDSGCPVRSNLNVLGAMEMISNPRLKKPLRVLVADDSPLARSAIQRLLASRKEVEMVGVAEDGADAVTQAEALCPDLILMDLQMPKLDGLRATTILRSSLPGVRVIIVTVNHGAEVRQSCLTSGANGFVVKDRIFQDLIAEIRRIFPPPPP